MIGQVISHYKILEKLGHGGPPLGPDPDAVQGVVTQAREDQDGLAERLARDGPRLAADAPDHPAGLDDGDALPQLGRLDRRPLTGWTAPDAEEVEVSHIA